MAYIQWEYLTIFVHANARDERVKDFVAQRRDWKGEPPRYTPEAMIPELNSLGEQGWELVHMQPVYVGDNHDVLVASDSGAGGRIWASRYFCVFKRPVGAS